MYTGGEVIEAINRPSGSNFKLVGLFQTGARAAEDLKIWGEAEVR